MGFHHLFHPTIIVMIAFLTNSNSLSFSGDDDFLFSGAELPSDDGLLPLNSPEAFDSLFSDSNNNNNNNGDLFSKSENDDAFDLAEPFELAECSSFENSQDWPLIGKSRIRRVRSTCPNPDAVPGAGAAPLRSDFDNLPADAGAGLQTWGQDLIAERKNQQCQLMTIMLLAWGVCYQPTGEPLISHGRTTVPPKTVQSYYLDKCMLGMSLKKIKQKVRVGGLVKFS